MCISMLSIIYSKNNSMYRGLQYNGNFRNFVVFKLDWYQSVKKSIIIKTMH